MTNRLNQKKYSKLSSIINDFGNFEVFTFLFPKSSLLDRALLLLNKLDSQPNYIPSLSAL